MKSLKFTYILSFLLIIFVISNLCILVYANQEIKWTMFSDGGEVDWAGKQWKNVLIPEIEKITDGRLKIDLFFYGEYPFSNSELLSVVSKRSADMVMGSIASWSGTEPRLSIVDLPMLMPSSAVEKQRIYHIMSEDILKDVLEEWNCHEVLTTWMGAQDFYFKDFWLEDFNSFKGKKIRTFSPELDDLVRLLNGTPVRVDFAEVYTALQTGVAKGLITGITNAYNNMYFDVVKNMQAASIFICTDITLVNNDSWEKLPEDIKNKLITYFNSKREWYEMAQVERNGLALLKAIREHGLNVKPISKDLRKEIVNKAYEGIWKNWIERCGEGGQGIFDSTIKLLKNEGYNINISK